ncbi:alpha/beta fold hydrolase [Flavobacteriaceae bacterium R38]|nr:alpha/beta fold hydrolase [Flavobacteriaceae bacterium R38]
MTITDKFIELDNCRYSIRLIKPESPRSEQTIVFLHDALGSIPQWKEFPETIVKKTEIQAVIIERQGYGNSSPATKKRDRNYLHHEAWVVLPKILEKLNINTPILIGHSDGGSIALLYGAKHATESIISIAAHIFVEDKTLEGIKNTLRFENLIKPKLVKYHGDKAEKLFDEWQRIWLSEAFINWNLEWDISTIKCPVLVVQSDDDEYGTLKQVDGILDIITTKNKQKLVLDTGGHAPHFSNSEKVETTITDFILNL